MKTHIRLICLTALILTGCLVGPVGPDSPYYIPPERWVVDFGTEHLINVSNVHQRGFRMIESVPEGQNGDNWQEIVTDEFIVGHFPTTSYFVQINLADLSRQVSGFQSKVIYDTGAEALYEWWHPGSGKWPSEDQLSLAKYYPTGMMTLSYARKGPPMDDAAKAKWLERLKNAKLQ